MNRIHANYLVDADKIRFAINDDYDTLEKACNARLDFFDLPSVANYDKVLYLDTDIIIKGDINRVFDICKKNILYVLEEKGSIEEGEFWGKTLFGDEIDTYKEQTPFNSGIILFRNSRTIQYLFAKIKQDIIDRPYENSFYDQPYIVYNAFKYALYDNQKMKSVATFVIYESDYEFDSSLVLHHFILGVGKYEPKIKIMTDFLNKSKELIIEPVVNFAKEFIRKDLSSILTNSKHYLQGNVYMQNDMEKYVDTYLSRYRDMCSLLFFSRRWNILVIGFHQGFTILLMLMINPNVNITCVDIGKYTYTMPCYAALKAMFGDRIELLIGDSTNIISFFKGPYDWIHIYGGTSTEVVESDIREAYRLSKAGTLIMMDNYELYGVKEVWDRFVYENDLKKVENIENGLYYDLRIVTG